MKPYVFALPRALALAPELKLREVVPDDEVFLAQLYASTREEELAIVPWTDTEKTQFLQEQFNAQHAFYMQQFSAATFYIIKIQEKSVGRLYLDPRADEIRIVDIALLPSHRSGGLGSALLLDLIDAAESDRLAVRIHVEHNNRALSLYQRLGFRELSMNGIYRLMERRPGA